MKANAQQIHNESDNEFRDFIDEIGLPLGIVAKKLGYPSHSALQSAMERGFHREEIDHIEEVFREIGLALLSYKAPDSMSYWRRNPKFKGD